MFVVGGCINLVCQAEQYCILLAISVQLDRHSRALGVVCTSFVLFVRLGLGTGAWRVVGFWLLFHPVCRPSFSKHFGGKGLVAAAHRVGMDTLSVQVGLLRGLTLLSRHHPPSISIVDDFNCLLLLISFTSLLFLLCHLVY